MSMSMSVTFNESAITELKKVPLMLRLGPAERILKATAKPIVVRAKAIAPDSRVSNGTAPPSGDRRGKNKTAKYDPAAWEGRHAKDHIGFVFRKGESGGYLVIGGKNPLANSLNFDGSDRGRKVFYWGVDQGRIKRVEPSQRFMQKAFDETRTAQVSAGNAQLEKEMKELKLG